MLKFRKVGAVWYWGAAVELNRGFVGFVGFVRDVVGVDAKLVVEFLMMVGQRRSTEMPRQPIEIFSTRL